MTEQARTRELKPTVPCQFCDTLNRVDLGHLGDSPQCADCHKPILLDRPIKVTEETFDATVLKSPVPVLVDFHADWCGPCRTMAPHLDELANQAAGRILVVKVDTDRAPTLARQYNVRGIPFFGRFDGGQLTDSRTGAVGADGLQSLMA